MGRIFKAVVVSLLSILAFIPVELVGYISRHGGNPSPVFDFVNVLIFLGIIIPVPAALLLNMRDWLRARQKK